MAWIRTVAFRELRTGIPKRVMVEGLAIALVKLEDALYAIEDECPHEQGGSLSRGTLEKDSIWCPLHGARFSLVTGETLEPPEEEPMTSPVDRGVRTYPIAVIADDVYVEVPKC
jgi:3-phenylpropionate/trans-cinnamate dioxygenase ferredoxin subunit